MTDLYSNDTDLSIIFGLDSNQQFILSHLSRTKNILIGGSANSNIAPYIETIIYQLLTNSTPKTLQMYIIDSSHRRWLGLEEFSNNFLVTLNENTLESNSEILREILSYLMTKCQQRAEILRNSGKRNWREVSLEYLHSTPRDIVVVIYDYSIICKSDYITYHSIIRLAERCCALGIHIIAVTETPSLYPTSLINFSWCDISTTVCFGVNSVEDSKLILGYKGGETLNNKDDMIVTLDQSIYVRAKFIKDNTTYNSL